MNNHWIASATLRYVALVASFSSLLAAGCESGEAPTPPDVEDGTPCEDVADCGESRLCVLGRCRSECAGWSECPLGSACLEDPATRERGCRVDDEASCAGASDCPEGTECSAGVCRAQCSSSQSCGGTACVLADSLCEDPGDTHTSCGSEDRYCPSGVCAEFGCDLDLDIGLGAAITCTVRDSGEIDCAGSDAAGLLGDGDTEPAGGARATLAPAILSEPARAVGAGDSHACALLVGSEVYCWGAADQGQTAAAGATATPTLALAAPDDESGTVDQLAVGAHHACVRRASGAVECWGSDAAGQLGDEATHAACGSAGECSAAAVGVPRVDDAIDLAAGRHATCVVRASGAVECWGRADTGLLGEGGAVGADTCTVDGASVACRTLPTEVAGVQFAYAVSVGDTHACALDDDGVVWCWGESAMGQAGVDGGVAAPTEVSVPMAAVAIGVGRAHACALDVAGAVWCWGANDTGQRGQLGASGGAMPTAVPGLPTAFDLRSGRDHVCAFTSDGELWCWGLNTAGQLASGEVSASSSPARVTR